MTKSPRAPSPPSSSRPCPRSTSRLVGQLHVWVFLIAFLNTAGEISARSSLSFHYPTRGQQFWGRFRGGSSVSHNGPLDAVTRTSTDTQQPATPASSELSSNNNNTTQASPTNSSSLTEIPEWKARLPAPLCHKSSRTLQRISIPYQDQIAEIYLLGTAHVSNDSSRDVKLLLQSLHPDVIFVELCDQRTSLMEDPPAVLQQLNQTTPFWDKVKEVQFQNNNSKFQSIATVLLTQTQEEYADSLGVELGGEFRAAYHYWRSFDAATTTTTNSAAAAVGSKRPHLILGDRPLAITLARCWESLSWFGKLKVLVGLILSTFHKPKPEELRAWIQKILDDDETDLLKASLEDLRKHFPTLERVIIQERDAYMACKLYQLCRGMLVSAARSSTTTTGGLPLPDSHGNHNNHHQQAYAGSSTNHPNSHELSTLQQHEQDQRQQQQHPKPIVVAALVGAGHVPGICAWLTNKSHPQGPEAMLATLIETKKFKDHDLSQLVYDVTELQDLP